MLRGLIRAEWKKATGNRLLVSFLVWIVPTGIGAFFALAALASLVSETAALAMAGTSSGEWTRDVLGPWSLITSFPGNILGRLLPLAFMSVLFAGEYQWGTWRFALPRTSRTALLIVKAFTATAIVASAFLIASLLVGVGQIAIHRIVGTAYGPPITLATLADAAGGLGGQLALGLYSLLILAGFAAIGAMLTRSILGAVLVGFGLSVLEPMSQVMLIVLARVLAAPGIVGLYQVAATYHLDNARSWLVDAHPLPAPMAGFTAAPSLPASLLVLTLWSAGLLILAVAIFRRQDITT